MRIATCSKQPHTAIGRGKMSTNFVDIRKLFWATLLPLLAASSGLLAGTPSSESGPTPSPLTCQPSEPSKAKNASIPEGAESLAPAAVQEISQSNRVKFFISATDALARSTKALVVDVRSETEARETWIPGSVRIPVNFLSSSTLLHNASEIVVVTNVIDDLRLLKTLQGMPLSNASHFHIVEGGIRAWAQAGGALAGNPSALSGVAWVNASQFHELIRQGAKAVIIGKATHHQLQAIPDLVELRDETIRKRASTGSHALQGFHPIVLVARDVNSTVLPHGSSKELSKQPVYAFLDSGDNYFMFLRQQKEISNNDESITKPRCDWR